MFGFLPKRREKRREKREEKRREREERKMSRRSRDSKSIDHGHGEERRSLVMEVGFFVVFCFGGFLVEKKGNEKKKKKKKLF